jgi:hypothetical protein
MARTNPKRTERSERTIGAALTPGEQVVAQGPCWGAPLTGRARLLFTRRVKYVLVLTDRRFLVLAARRGADPVVVLAKHYEALELERFRPTRSFGLGQVLLQGPDGLRMVLEFRRKQRGLAHELADHFQIEEPV